MGNRLRIEIRDRLLDSHFDSVGTGRRPVSPSRGHVLRRSRRMLSGDGPSWRYHRRHSPLVESYALRSDSDRAVRSGGSVLDREPGNLRAHWDTDTYIAAAFLVPFWGIGGGVSLYNMTGPRTYETLSFRTIQIQQIQATSIRAGRVRLAGILNTSLI